MGNSCPFCPPEGNRVFFQTDLVVGLWDAFPVSPGHALLVLRRHVPDWFDATPAERKALVAGIDVARQAVLAKHAPDGFNIGVNVGAVAGQTVPHVHVHVIPRYAGDIVDPRGGVRHVIPAKANYLAGESETDRCNRLIAGDEDRLLAHLVEGLAVATRLDVAVSFVMRSGVRELQEHLRDLLARGGQLRMVVGDYMEITDPDALLNLLDLCVVGRADLRVFESSRRATDGRSHRLPFHPKGYILHVGDGRGLAVVGSSNLSRSALTEGVEWNYRIVSSNDAHGFSSVTKAFERLLAHGSVVPLTTEWVESYRRRRVIVTAANPAESSLLISDVEPEPEPVPTPNVVQEEALVALDATRQAGNRAGLVVLATGLGKTWLSAFDTARPEFKRVLFVAHREEILGQALKTFRRIRPSAHLGLYAGGERDASAEVLFASIQTMGRVAHLERFDPETFDYIVVDEFHHAAAATYRRLIDHFKPKFLLGLTATPERTDGGDLLAMCQENVVYRCDLDRGIRLNLLCPFHYFGVPDEVDYSNIPWRSNRFDEEALTTALATQARAQNALEQWRLRAGLGTRTIAFCASQRHADFMAAFFRDHGLRAAAVHSGPTSAPRALSLEQLAAGELDIVCTVDIFNEGVDLPLLDTVLMLRPTESRIVFVQQFGRGLRIAPGKERLTVVDYIGNHRAFLLKPQTLFNLPPGRHEIANLIERYRRNSLDLPPGCEVTYELEALNILRGLVPTTGQVGALQRYYEDFRELHGVRPTASEAFHDGYSPRSARTVHGSWLAFVQSQDGLTKIQHQTFQAHRAWFEMLEVTPMTRSYKMLTLLAMLNADKLPGAIGIDELSKGVQTIASRTTFLSREFGAALNDDPQRQRLLEGNPIDAWVGAAGTGGVSYFTYSNERFGANLTVPLDQREAFQELTRELVDWRLAEYLDRARNASQPEEGAFTCRVSQANGTPMIFLPDRAAHPGVPSGWTELRIDGETMHANFVQIALNVVRREGADANELPRILRAWFGPDAGQPGTNHRVSFERRSDTWYLFPVGRKEGVLQRWRSYSREQIPPLFGMEFSEAIWNVGYVRRNGHIFLLVTLDKGGHSESFQYSDRFLSPDLFQWQSQNRTRQASTDGEEIRNHRERNVPVHLFVRHQKKMAGGGAAPFVYCGDVEFVDWEGEKPITVRWRLPESVPQRLRAEWSVPK